MVCTALKAGLAEERSMRDTAIAASLKELKAAAAEIVPCSRPREWRIFTWCTSSDRQWLRYVRKRSFGELLAHAPRRHLQQT